MPPNKPTEKDDELWGPDGPFIPTRAAPDQRDSEALRLFQSFLCNSSTQRQGLSNVIMLWELVPKYRAEFFNKLPQSQLPPSYTQKFKISDQEFSLTIFSGTYRLQKPAEDGTTHRRKYPGIHEQAVEQGLIHLACEQAEAEDVDGKTEYSIKFTIRDLRRVMQSMGRTMSHYQIRESLEVLRSTLITITRPGDKVTKERPRPILLTADRDYNEAMVKNATDHWEIRLHPVVSGAIRNATYRQYPLEETKGFPPFAAYLIRQMHYAAPNISMAHPFTFELKKLQESTPGLNHKQFRGSIKALERELERMKDKGLLTEYEIEQVFPSKPKMGRPTPIDAVVTLYPADKWIQNVKRGSRRLTATERSLGLPRSERSDRQMSLPIDA